MLVVGGGDAALEAACSVAEQPGTTVTLSHRSDSFNRAKPKNRDASTRCGTIGAAERPVPFHRHAQIDPDDVEIEADGSAQRLRNDAVIVCVGGILPTPFLESMGIEVETKYGTA